LSPVQPDTHPKFKPVTNHSAQFRVIRHELS
jgi:hypothetical protein